MTDEERAREVAQALTPMQGTWVKYLLEDSVYRTNEGTTGDVICSGLCSGEHVLVKWQTGDRSGWDGPPPYTEQYSLTPFGILVAQSLEPARND